MERKFNYDKLRVVDIDISHGEFLIGWQCEGIGLIKEQEHETSE